MSNIARLARVLDDIEPDWYLKVDTKRLNMISATDCILGQVFGHFISAIETYKVRFDREVPTRLGDEFASSVYVPLWVQEIESRLEDKAMALQEESL